MGVNKHGTDPNKVLSNYVMTINNFAKASDLTDSSCRIGLYIANADHYLNNTSDTYQSFGIVSRNSCIGPSFIDINDRLIILNSSTAPHTTFDLSRASFFMVHANMSTTITLPTADDIQKSFGNMFTGIIAEGAYIVFTIMCDYSSYKLTINDVYGPDGNIQNAQVGHGDSITLVAQTSADSVRYNILNRTT